MNYGHNIIGRHHAAMFEEALDHIIKLGEKAYEEQFSSYPEARKELLIAINYELLFVTGKFPMLD